MQPIHYPQHVQYPPGQNPYQLQQHASHQSLRFPVGIPNLGQNVRPNGINSSQSNPQMAQMQQYANMQGMTVQNVQNIQSLQHAQHAQAYHQQAQQQQYAMYNAQVQLLRQRQQAQITQLQVAAQQQQEGQVLAQHQSQQPHALQQHAAHARIANAHQLQQQQQHLIQAQNQATIAAQQNRATPQTQFPQTSQPNQQQSYPQGQTTPGPTSQSTPNGVDPSRLSQQPQVHTPAPQDAQTYAQHQAQQHAQTPQHPSQMASSTPVPPETPQPELPVSPALSHTGSLHVARMASVERRTSRLPSRAATPVTVVASPQAHPSPSTQSVQPFQSSTTAGQAILKLMQFTERMGVPAENRHDIDYWRKNLGEYFTRTSVYKSKFLCDAQEKSYEFPSYLLPHYFERIHAVGVVSLRVMLEDPKEYPLGNSVLVETSRATLIYQFEHDVQVSHSGRLRVHFSSGFKIEFWEFTSNSYLESIPRRLLFDDSDSYGRPSKRRKLSQGSVAASIPESPIAELGIPDQLKKWLEMVDAMRCMKELVALTGQQKNGPRHSLKALLTLVERSRAPTSQFETPRPRSTVRGSTRSPSISHSRASLPPSNRPPSVDSVAMSHASEFSRVMRLKGENEHPTQHTQNMNGQSHEEYRHASKAPHLSATPNSPLISGGNQYSVSPSPATPHLNSKALSTGMTGMMGMYQEQMMRNAQANVTTAQHATAQMTMRASAGPTPPSSSSSGSPMAGGAEHKDHAQSAQAQAAQSQAQSLAQAQQIRQAQLQQAHHVQMHQAQLQAQQAAQAGQQAQAQQMAYAKMGMTMMSPGEGRLVPPVGVRYGVTE